MTEFVRVSDVLALAEAVIGRPPVVRDVGLIVSACGRPQAAFAGVEAYPSVHLKAAALLESLAGNHHALVDGNKRTALASLLFFYDLNGYRVTLSHDEAYDLVIGIVHQIDIEKAADLLRRRTEAR